MLNSTATRARQEPASRHSGQLPAPQVAPDHYDPAIYDTPERLYSYGCQIEIVLDDHAGSVLEVGVGNGFVCRYLRDYGLSVTTCDIDPGLNPTVVGSVTDLPFDDCSFELVSCCEVLEHLPYEDVSKALSELARVTRRVVLLSVPDVSPYLHWDVSLPHFGALHGLRSFDVQSLSKHHWFDGQHYWELGKRGYPLRKLMGSVREAGLTPKRWFRASGNPIHRFIVATKD